LFHLAGKVIIITGSTAGLGRELAEALFQCGASVVVNGRAEDRTVKAANEIYEKFGKAEGLLAMHGDMSIMSDVDALVEKTLQTFGKIDCIINNAGINLEEAPFEAHTDTDWERISNTNMRGPINLCRAAIPYLKNSKCGRIINFSSIGGHVGLPTNVMYTMTKGAILLFSKSLAAELATTGICVNSISPGVMQTRMNSKFTANDEAGSEVNKLIPMARMGFPSELVGAVIYLASDASSYTTGADIIIDGGYTCV
jgi:NAD(P)-dependent dehydrogenase (short-subunit alcohol dehydrogenase family)